MLLFTKTTLISCFPSQIQRPSSSRHGYGCCIRSSSEKGNEGELPISISTPAEIRFKRGGSRRRRRKEVDDDDVKIIREAAGAKKKDWDSMSLGEKAVEIYVGEKGVLYWVNKLAYASIYIIIGGWILFRFVGPALNLYQLDTPPLAPTSLFKG